MRKLAAPLVLALLCAGAFGCGSVPVLSELFGPASTFTPTGTPTSTATSTNTPTPSPTSTPTNTPTPTKDPCLSEASGSEKVKVRWFVGLGTGTDPIQVITEQSVVQDFNKSQDKIELILEIVSYDKARDTLAAEMASGDGPDIIGPVGWASSHPFLGQWLDLAPLLACNNFDASQFNPALMEMYRTSEGLVGLPFTEYPSAVIYNKNLFAGAGLSYPPAHYGEKYKMPDGAEVDWTWDTVAEVARLLTRDSSGRNAASSKFNKEKITQYGFTWQFENHPNYWGSFWAGGSMLAPGGSSGAYSAAAPDAWKAAWEWTYEAIWGDQPFMGNAEVEGSKALSYANPFNSRKVAMTVQPIWYTCCMGNVRSWDLAAMPAYNGRVGGRIDGDSFRVWKGTRHPQETFTVLTYLTGEAVKKLVIGTPSLSPAYSAVPARIADQAAWVKGKKAVYPWVRNWDVIIAGLSYPDIPSAEAWVPNYDEAWMRGNTFANLLRNTPGLDLDREIQIYLTDLDVIFNK
jgi:multiple sugar transport system substrate-binding protein